MKILNMKNGIDELTFQPTVELTVVFPIEPLKVISEEDAAMMFYTKFKSAMTKYKSRPTE